MRVLVLRPWLCAALLGACNSTGIGNPGGPATVSLALVPDNDQAEPSAEPDAEALSLPRASIRTAILVLDEVRFLPCEPEIGEPRVVSGPFVVDLVNRETRPPLPPIEETDGGFCAIEAPLGPAREPGTLRGRSLFFRGTRDDGLEFMVFADLRVTLRVQARMNVSFSPESSAQMFWAFRPRRWLDRQELGREEPLDSDTDDEGRRLLVINADRHPVLYRSIARRLAASSTLYADENGDGVFSDADRGAVLGDGVEDDAE